MKGFFNIETYTRPDITETGTGRKNVWGLDLIPKVLQYISTFNKHLKIALFITY